MELEVKKAKEVLKKLLAVKGLPVLLNGPSGVGKTSIVREIAKELGLPLIDFRLSTETPENIGGIPIPESDDSQYFVKLLNKRLKPAYEGGAVLFFDELNRSNSWVQNAAMEAFFERTLGGKRLDEKTIVIGAVNVGADYNNTEKLEKGAMLSRFAIVNIRADFELAHFFIPDEGHEYDSEFDFLFESKRSIIENLFFKENRYTPLEPRYTGRNLLFARLIYRMYRNDSDLPILLRCILPSQLIDIVMSGYDLRKVEMILEGNYDFQIEETSEMLTLVSIALARKNLTKNQVINVLRFAERYIEEAGTKDAMIGILQRFAMLNKEIFARHISDIIREFPWIKDLVGR